MSNEGTPKRTFNSDDEEEEEQLPRRDKRARRGPSPYVELLPNGYRNGENGAKEGHEFQPGAIRRVKLSNFVTYSSVEFFPGPSLNMVIGPNGTGKSTLVCAICIGLGYDPKYLGRAKEVSEFVKHGAQEATIEIELQRPKESSQHPVVRCNIKRDGNKAMYTINKRPFSGKQVKARVGKLGVQIDNLCQFLPQDRVVEFAGMTPVELLKSTQRAVASQAMLDWHEQLKTLRKNQRELQHGKKNEGDELANLEAQHRRQEADVQRIRERQEVRGQIGKLQSIKPLVDYEHKVASAKTAKQKADQLAGELGSLEEAMEPAMREVNAKDEYRKAISNALQDRKGKLEGLFRQVQEQEDAVKEIESNSTSLNSRQTQRRKDLKAANDEMNKIKLEIRGLQKRLDEPPPVTQEKLDEAFEKIRRIGREERENRETYERIEDQRQDLQRQIREREGRIRQHEVRLRNLDSKVGKQNEKLNQINSETARAWRWVQQNQNLFEKQVYGPPMVECTMKNARDVDMIESLIAPSEMIVLTTQTNADFRLLRDKLREQGLSRVNQRHVGELSAFRAPVTKQELQNLGFDDWVLDRISGPEPVLSSLCEGAKIHATAFASKELSDEQFRIASDSNLNQWVSPGGTFRVTRRREYGPSAVSTTTRAIRKAKHWSDEPVDASLTREIKVAINELTSGNNDLEAELRELGGNKIRALETRRADLKHEMTEAREQQRQYQSALTEHKALPVKLERAEARLNSKADDVQKLKETIREMDKEYDSLLFDKCEAAVRQADVVEETRLAFEEVQEAEIILIEANSDLQVLTERNSEITQQLEDKRQEHQQAQQEANGLRKQVKELAVKLKRHMADLDDEIKDFFQEKRAELKTVADVDSEVEALQARLSLLQGDDGGRTLKVYEERAEKIAKLRQKLEDYTAALEEVTRKVDSVRKEWEPRLEKLVTRISKSFEYNMKQINCAGEVEIFKDEDDFDRWAIHIKVKFRENEPLSQLDSHRQSGGERAVSTIFYLMSLQALTRSPFRVVDEINQGMDPRNERLVHARMVRIATGQDDMPVQQIRIPRRRREENDDDDEDDEGMEDGQTQNGNVNRDNDDEDEDMEDDQSQDEDEEGEGVDSTGRPQISQYFLITPKLLPDLQYEDGMRVLCIGSGEHMPAAEKGLVDFARAFEIRSGLTATAAG